MLMVDEDNGSCHEAPSWWWLSTQGRPGPSQRSLSHLSSSCPCKSSHTLNKDVRSPRKVMWPDEGEESGGEGHPALLIDRHVHPETILLGKLQTESFKTLKISLIFCKPICLPLSPDQSFVRHLVGALFAKTKRRVDVLQDLQSLRVVNFPPVRTILLRIILKIMFFRISKASV